MSFFSHSAVRSSLCILLNSSSLSTILSILCIKKLSIPVIPFTFSMLYPLLNSSAVIYKSSSQGFFILSLRSTIDILEYFSFNSVYCEFSRDLTALRRAASKLFPIAITSPVAAIWVPKLLISLWSLSNGHFGILRTT